MNNPENLTYSIDKTRLRMGAAVGVLVIAAAKPAEIRRPTDHMSLLSPF